MTNLPEPKGVAAILNPNACPSVHRSIFSDFALPGRVAVITGGHRGIGLEMAFALAEAGAIVYCVDLPAFPDSDWEAVKQHVDKLSPLSEEIVRGAANKPSSKSKLVYISADVTDQDGTRAVFKHIAETEGRVDVCVACAGILRSAECLEYPGDEFRKLIDINVNGVFFTAQAAARQMVRLGIPGSIILIASMSGSIANRGQNFVAYNTSKSAVLQMARSMACELAPQKIRVNTISPGYILTDMTKAYLDPQPKLHAEWSSQNPMDRLGRPDELRGVVTWLASDASTYCTGSDMIVDGGHRAW
ncbi:hypothetical protein SERLA73DRAFT_175211 [Serpula lacrymans var. lacrymans S7.3]|uniref:Sorbose reductase sou1 n=2 Tax=Serpula lacrymans var. lacrymans TaxID=341189 RepID=F8PL10_SERL3|nr:uncharacterized protein SERLADRAFT_457362 [Serpula lacrymans var. lacrymans S7.9]EGO03654.1 hypothetical protein SERLA73DRAFT_175211 [Serpula lacrymans var. lacrymans S7.3]EGO29520.1 hypothetical protein SERLADRAFT_457362 [Serpula lacrymans var. lacrymans S7.9]